MTSSPGLSIPYSWDCGSLHPIDAARQGEETLRQRLAVLSLEQLKDVVADYGMDPGKLVMKWKTPERIINRIVEFSLARAVKGGVFLKWGTGAAIAANLKYLGYA
jgi:hypothetical protein